MNPLSVQIEKPVRKSNIFYNAVVLLAIFGLFGGIFAWIGGELLGAGPDLESQAQDLKRQVRELVERSGKGGAASPDVVRQVSRAVDEIKLENTNNPYFTLFMQEGLNLEQRAAKKAEIDRAQSLKKFVANLLSFASRAC